MGEKLCKKIPSIKILPEYFEEVIAGRKEPNFGLTIGTTRRVIYTTFVSGILRGGDIPEGR